MAHASFVSVDAGNLLSAAVALASFLAARRAGGKADKAHVAAKEATEMAETMAKALEQHYSRVEASYEASREATMSLLAYLQGRHNGGKPVP